MGKKLSNIVTKRLNWFPVKGGISLYYITNVIMHGLLLDY